MVRVRRSQGLVAWVSLAGWMVPLLFFFGGRGEGEEGEEGIVGRPELITADAEKAIQRGLAFLIRAQAKDGSWRGGGGSGGYPTVMTSLAGLALMGSGSTPNEGPYAIAVRKGVDFVLGACERSGLIAFLGEEGRPMYSHGFGMLFLGLAYGMGHDPLRQATLSRALHRAVELTGRSQSGAGGWLYTPDANGDEGSVTITQIQGLRACRNAGIKVPKSIIERAVKYIAACSCKDGGIAYSLGSAGSSRPAITAAAVATLYNAGAYDDPVALRALAYLKRMKTDGKSYRVFMGHQFYSMLYLAQAMFLSGDEDWRGFFPGCRDELISLQGQNGGWQGDGVGEVYGTAIALIVLQLPYRFLPIFQR